MEDENLYFLFLLLLLILPMVFITAFCCRRSPSPKLQRIEYFHAPERSTTLVKNVQSPPIYPVFVPEDFVTLPNEGVSKIYLVPTDFRLEGSTGHFAKHCHHLETTNDISVSPLNPVRF